MSAGATPEDHRDAESEPATVTCGVPRDDGTCAEGLCVALFGGICGPTGCEFVARMQAATARMAKQVRARE